jgi:predicted permease
LLHVASLTAPLFLLVLLGFALSRFGWPRSASDALTRFVFTVAVPTLLFRLMSDFSRLPRVDGHLLVAFFGGCLVVYAIGRIVAAFVFRMDGVGQSVFAMGGIFSNNVLLGIPLAKVTLGDAAMPAVSLVLVFNSLVLWTLVTVSVEWARHRDFSLSGFWRTTSTARSRWWAMPRCRCR